MPRGRDGAALSARIVNGAKYARVGRGCKEFCTTEGAARGESEEVGKSDVSGAFLHRAPIWRPIGQLIESILMREALSDDCRTGPTRLYFVAVGAARASRTLLA